jgi:hypothetical protein
MDYREWTALIRVEALKLQGLKYGTVHCLPAEVVALELEMYEVLKES